MTNKMTLMKLFGNNKLLQTLCLLLLIQCLTPCSATGQRRRRRTPRKPKVEVRDTLRLAHAVFDQQELQATIDSSTYLQTFMYSPKQIVVVDTLVLPKKEMFQHLFLNKECGQYVPISQLHLNTSLHCIPMAQVVAMGDKAYFAARAPKDSVNAIYQAVKINGKWGQIQRLDIYQAADYNMALPYMMPDGTTLYFSAKHPKGVGGYDLFVTRYDNDSKRFLKPENLGLPFSSLGNDYMYLLDEYTGIATCATDFNQPHDSIMLFHVDPQATRRTALEGETSAQHLLQQHQLVRPLSPDEQRIKQQAQQRLTQAKALHLPTAAPQFRFYLHQNVFYTDIAQFKSKKARELVNKWLILQSLLTKTEREWHDLQSAYRKHLINHSDILLQKETEVNTLKEKKRFLEQQIRQQELIK